MAGATAFPQGIAGAPASEAQAAQEERTPDPAPGLGVKEVPKAGGSGDKTYYSVTAPGEEEEARQEEKEKMEKSLDVLRNILIDRRRKK